MFDATQIGEGIAAVGKSLHSQPRDEGHGGRKHANGRRFNHGDQLQDPQRAHETENGRCRPPDRDIVIGRSRGVGKEARGDLLLCETLCFTERKLAFFDRHALEPVDGQGLSVEPIHARTIVRWTAGLRFVLIDRAIVPGPDSRFPGGPRRCQNGRAGYRAHRHGGGE